MSPTDRFRPFVIFLSGVDVEKGALGKDGQIHFRTYSPTISLTLIGRPVSVISTFHGGISLTQCRNSSLFITYRVVSRISNGFCSATLTRRWLMRVCGLSPQVIFPSLTRAYIGHSFTRDSISNLCLVYRVSE